jgi:hypothetical protein
MTEVFSSGGGTQSCCIAALIVQGELPKPDFVVIADTGMEMPTTWAYLDSVVRPALKSVGIEVHRVSKEQYGQAWGMGIFSKDSLLIPAFSDITGAPSKLSAFCSKAWKQVVVDNFLSREHGLTRSKYRKWIGFSFDEDRRIHRMMAGKEYKSGLIRFPLVQDIPTRRHEAIRIVEKMGWPSPPRSRCWMCPNQSDMEWYEVKRDYPELFDEAVGLDESIRRIDAHAYLHSSVKPLRLAELNPREDLFSASCPSGECFL